MNNWKQTQDISFCPMSNNKDCATCMWYRTWVNSPIKEGEPGRCSNPGAIGRGSVVQIGRSTYTVEKVLSVDYWERYGYDLEFIDSKGGYHHWKQYEDNGTLM